MKKTSLWLLGVISITSVVIVNSCKKHDSQSASGKDISQQVLSWLNTQKTQSNAADADKVQALINKLDFSKLRYENLNEQKHFVIVPIDPGFRTPYSPGTDPIKVLLLKVFNSGAIDKGYIVEYTPVNNTTDEAIPTNYFYKLYHSENLGSDGRFLFLNLNQTRAYAYTYENGQMTTYSRAKSRPATTAVNTPPQDPISPEPICTDWYWVTTTFYADGHSETTWEFAFTTCVSGSSGGEGGQNQNECCEGGGDMTVSTTAGAEMVRIDCGVEGIDPVSGNSIKNCTVQWNCNSNRFLVYTWNYLSIETAVQEKIGTAWKFKSVVHSGYSLNGQLPPCIDFVSTVSTSVVDISAEKTRAFVRLYINNSLNIRCIPFSSPTTNNVSPETNFGING